MEIYAPKMLTEGIKVGCIRAGTIGHSWALLFTMKGHSVILQDVELKSLNDAIERIKLSCKTLVKAEVLKEGDVKSIVDRISTTTSMAEAVCKADYVQEFRPRKFKCEEDGAQRDREIHTIACRLSQQYFLDSDK